MEFIEITFTDDEEYLNECVKEYNELCSQGLYPNILEYTHYKLAQISNITSTTVWKDFLLNPKIKEWYRSEQEILLKTQIQKLLAKAGDSHSTAEVQALNTLLAQQKLMKESETNNTVIVYQFVPLTEEERKNKNVKECQTIPTGIRRAITHIEDSTNNK